MQPLSYTPLEPLSVTRPVDRIAYIVEQCRGRKVLDLGCYDETALEKVGSGHWLHEEIARVAERVVGIDSSPNLPEGGLVAAPNARIVRGDVMNIRAVLPGDFVPDVIVAGELIEHLPNAGAFFIQLKELFPGKVLLASTPNATSLTNVVLACVSRESNHHDHVQVFSYKTLNTLCVRAGFSKWKLVPYRVYYTEMALRNRGLRRALVHGAEAVIGTLERIFPLLSLGMLLHVDRL